METLSVGTKVAYASAMSGTILGKVERTGTDSYGDYYVVKVTSRGNVAYPNGDTFEVYADSEWIKSR